MGRNDSSGRKIRIYWIISILFLMLMAGSYIPDGPLFDIYAGGTLLLLIWGLWWISYGSFGED